MGEFEREVRVHQWVNTMVVATGLAWILSQSATSAPGIFATLALGVVAIVAAVGSARAFGDKNE